MFISELCHVLLQNSVSSVLALPEHKARTENLKIVIFPGVKFDVIFSCPSDYYRFYFGSEATGIPPA
jgi:hypothetical protein